MGALDQRFAPMLAVSGELPSDDAQWAFEVKWDGVRALTYVQDGVVRMESRNLLDITPRYPEVHGLAETVGGVGAVLDGEVVTFDEEGRPSFQLLQSRMHVQGPRDVQRLMARQPVVYVVFDVLWLAGQSTLALPYAERRRLLERLDLDGPAWRVSAHRVGGGAAMLAAGKERGLEGIVAKKLDTPYEPGRRSRWWVKVKNVRRQEVVVGGWLEGTRNREGRIGALLVGYYDDGVLRFAGKVGTGYTDRTLEELAATLAPLARDTSPFGTKVPYKKPNWVEPVLVCEVEFTEWTAGGTLRHPSYKGLRDDKRPHDVVREP
ncbi:MAG TPA: non-homologous end-joining DNA ligase [Acidimicrobiales bacterium]|nr:non-homologous end-joining DNA ligase [Acidimicrobiales bacterium]